MSQPTLRQECGRKAKGASSKKDNAWEKKKATNIIEKRFYLLLSAGSKVRVKGLQPRVRLKVRVWNIGFSYMNR